MFPVLFSLGPFQVRAYGLALALSFLVGSGLALRRGRQRGIDEDRLIGLFWWILISAIVGARLYFVVSHPEEFSGVLSAVRIWEGGLVLYGGLGAAVLVSWIYLKRQGLPFLPVADALSPSLALGETITRIGCFFNGCCFGHACQGPLGIHYPPESYAGRTLGVGVTVCPSQLILSGSLLLVFFLLLAGERRWNRAGITFGLFLVLQGVIRYTVDFTRYYDAEDHIAALAPWIPTRSQLGALLAVGVGVAVLLRARRGRAAPGPRSGRDGA